MILSNVEFGKKKKWCNHTMNSVHLLAFRHLLHFNCSSSEYIIVYCSMVARFWILIAKTLGNAGYLLGLGHVSSMVHPCNQILDTSTWIRCGCTPDWSNTCKLIGGQVLYKNSIVNRHDPPLVGPVTWNFTVNNEYLYWNSFVYLYGAYGV